MKVINGSEMDSDFLLASVFGLLGSDFGCLGFIRIKLILFNYSLELPGRKIIRIIPFLPLVKGLSEILKILQVKETSLTTWLNSRKASLFLSLLIADIV